MNVLGVKKQHTRGKKSKTALGVLQGTVLITSLPVLTNNMSDTSTSLPHSSCILHELDELDLYMLLLLLNVLVQRPSGEQVVLRPLWLPLLFWIFLVRRSLLTKVQRFVR